MADEKLLLPIDGLPLVEYAIRAARSSCLDEISLICRHDGIAQIGVRYLVKIVHNEHALEGQSAAIKLGVVNAHREAEALMFLVGDQPFLTHLVINTLIDSWKETPGHIIVPLYNGKKGNPVIFPGRFKNDLLTLSGDSGGRTIIEENGDRVKLVEIADVRAGFDIDTKEDYARVNRSILAY